MPNQPTPEDMERIGAALAAGKKIEAIKLYRETSGVGLKEAKEFVEALGARLKAEDPAKYFKVGASGGSGCASVLLIGLTVGIAGSIWLARHLILA